MNIQDLMNPRKGEKIARTVNGIGTIVGGIVFIVFALLILWPEDGNISDSLPILLIPIVGGILVIIAGIVRIKKAQQKTTTDVFMETRGEMGSENPEDYLNRDYTKTASTANSYTPDPTASFDNLSVNAQKYYFMPDKKFSQGYYMEDENRQVVYKAPMIKNSLVKEFEFEFTNMLTGSSKVHKVGHTVTVEHDSFTDESGFTFDGMDIWELIKSLGIILNTDGNIMKPVFKVYRGKVLIGIIECSGVKVHEEDAQGFLAQNLITRGFYRIQADPKDMEMVFFVAFAISRSESQVHRTY